MRKLGLFLAAVLIAILVVSCGTQPGGKTQNSGSAKENGAKVTPPAASGNAAIDISNFAFSPETATVKKGTEVVWTNNDDATHEIGADDNSFSSPSLEKGDTFSFVFEKAGTFPYTCTIHPSMTGTIVVK